MIKFVPRPKGEVHGAITEALRQTARNGKAILLPSTSLSRLYHQMARWGLRVHVLKNGARRSYVWCEKAVK